MEVWCDDCKSFGWYGWNTRDKNSEAIVKTFLSMWVTWLRISSRYLKTAHTCLNLWSLLVLSRKQPKHRTTVLVEPLVLQYSNLNRVLCITKFKIMAPVFHLECSSSYAPCSEVTSSERPTAFWSFVQYTPTKPCIDPQDVIHIRITHQYGFCVTKYAFRL